MRKIFVVTLLITLSNLSHAKWLPGENNRCFLDDSGWNESWFCGTPADTCSGKKTTGGRRDRYQYYHGQSIYENGTKYWCCDGQPDKIGRFIEASSFYKTEAITVQLDGGATCNYTRKTDICGNVVSDNKCTVPDQCPPQTMLRNGQCVAPCDDGFVFESATINRCVECPTTKSQAIRDVGYDKTCVTCASNQILNTDTWTCKDYTIISRETMAKCWQCPTTAYYKECVMMFSQQDTKLQESYPNRDKILSECKIEKN